MTVWTSNEPSLPVTTTPLHRKVFDAMRKRIDADVDAVAFVKAEDADDVTTFREMYELSLKTANWLQKRGFGPGDVLQGFTHNCPEYVAVILGADVVGSAVAMFTPLLTANEVRPMLCQNEAKLVFTDSELLETVLQAVQGTNAKTVLCLDTLSRTTETGIEVVGFADIHQEKLFDLSFQRTFNADDVVVMPYSSGTTGMPKAVQLTNQSISTMLDIMCMYGDKWKKQLGSENNYTLVQQTLYHIYGFLMTFRCLINSERAVHLRKFDPVVFFTAIQRYKIEVIYVVPPLVLLLVKSPLVANYDLSSVRVAVCAAAPCGKQLIDAFLAKFQHLKIVQAYGSTEMGVPSNMPNFEGDSDYETVGKISANYELKVVDPKTGVELEVDQPGEVVVRSPTLFKCYLKSADDTRFALRDGWFFTGDLGLMQADGRLRFIERMKELIKVRTLQVAPSELEDVLQRHPLIADAAVTRVDHPETFEAPYAFVVRRSKELTEADVKRHVEENLAEFKQLRGGVEFVEKIPRGPTGKILRYQLYNLLQERSRQG